MAGRVASRIALFVVGAIPGAAGFFAGQPVLGGALLVACEALVAVGSIAGDVAAELRKRWTARLVDRVDAALNRRVAGFERVYRDKMLSTFRFMDSKGLPTKGFFTPELDDVYVHVKVAPGVPHKVRADLLASAEVAERHQLGDFLSHAGPQILAVVGAPGSGKTTLLRHTAKEACVRRRAIPVLLYLRDHVAQIVEDPSVALPVLIRSALTRQGITDPDGWFEDRLQTGRCLVLLDGLDEVARAADRRLIAEWVDAQVARYAKNDFVITSRPAGYRSAEIDNARVLQVCNFNSEQVRSFVQRWYLALEKAVTKADADVVQNRARESAADLLERLDRAPALYELTVNPLLLTMIANVHHYRGALPGNRVDLYGEICQAMLWRRQEAKKLSADDVPGEKKEALLRRLAFTMMERELRDLPRPEVLTLLRPALRRVSRDLTAEDFLADVSSNGLLIERESSLYSFAHLTFQEYLAASYIRDRSLAGVLAANVDNVWWRETTLLYTARSDADEIVLACLESATVPALSLAFDCVDQNSELDPELREQLEELLATAFKPDTNPEQRRLMTAVVVIRHLRQLVRTDTGMVCARPITNQIYRLFLMDTGRPEPDGFDPSSPDDHLVVGVHASDAATFAEWASALTEHQTVYRLVRRIELYNADVKRTIMASAPNAPSCGVWMDPNFDDQSDVPHFWPSSTANEDQYRVTAPEFTAQVRRDVELFLPDLMRLALVRMLIAVGMEGYNAVELETHLRSRQFPFDPQGRQTLDTVVANFLEMLTPANHNRADKIMAAVSPELASVLALEPSFDGTRSADQTMGVVWSRTLLDFLLQKANITSSDDLAGTFLRNVGMADNVHVLAPADVADKAALLRALGHLDHTWGGRVAAAVAQMAESFGRYTQMTERAAAALRLAVLCLDHEEVMRLDLDLVFVPLKIAAGTMLMEKRARGESPPTETIVLAVS
ncbi:NACHT domain-containing protein [Kutzneria sp. CA-103260]|uniref:NACHT domain-containing protein n=1 Tax=Kutzneria sp. CA-103260 TaxID=2802641 RepID=UPI001BA97E54|nr:NACHT domain-containing protein [Kutzneria sp. CA-103260]QUQ63780.1 NACHT domain protein [Kutzneria sp. CA-103260]